MSNISTTDSVRSIATDNRTDGNNRAASQTAAKAATTSGNEVPSASSQPAANNAQRASAQASERAVAQLNDYVQSFQRDLKFSLDADSGRAIVRVIDSSTNEVIRQIPNDVALRLARNLKANLQNIQSQELAELAKGDVASAEVSFGLINTKI